MVQDAATALDEHQVFHAPFDQVLDQEAAVGEGWLLRQVIAVIYLVNDEGGVAVDEAEQQLMMSPSGRR